MFSLIINVNLKITIPTLIDDFNMYLAKNLLKILTYFPYNNFDDTVSTIREILISGRSEKIFYVSKFVYCSLISS